MTSDPFASVRERVVDQLRAAARDFLEGHRSSSDARRRVADRLYRREVDRVASATMEAAWTKALSDERAAMAAKEADDAR